MVQKEATKTIKSFTDLVAWQKSHELVLSVYELTKDFPSDELFGLVSQMRRAAVSVTSNIAEGFSRQSYADKAHFYAVAQGSLTELQNQLLISRDVGHIAPQKFVALADQSVASHKLLSGLIKSTKRLHAS